MPVLVVGATGGIGSQVVRQLLDAGYPEVRVVVRSTKKFQDLLDDESVKDRLKVTTGTFLNLPFEKCVELVDGCEAVVSGLGHNMSFRGMFLPPRQLVLDTAKRLVEAVSKSQKIEEVRPVKFLFVNTVGVSNPDGSDKKIRSLGQNFVLGLLDLLLPPFSDNVKAAKYFFNLKNKNDLIEFACVRPDSLLDEDVSEYEVFPDLQTGLFQPRVTNRKNVAHFMVKCITDTEEWNKWKNGFPVVLNKK